jgi:hypothetical protein
VEILAGDLVRTDTVVRSDVRVLNPLSRPLDVGAWIGISIPFALENPSANSLFAASLGRGRSETSWKMERWNPVQNAYGPAEELAPGEGYWFNRKDLGIGSGQPLSFGFGFTTPLASFSVPARPGWNQVATPFAFPTQWPNGVLKEWDVENENYVDIADGKMLPFRAYWYENTGTETQTVVVNPDAAPSGAPTLLHPSTFAAQFHRGWAIRFSLRTREGADRDNFAAVRPDAAEAADAYDLGEPPSPAPGAILRFREGDRLLSSDVRPLPSEAAVWTLVAQADRNLTGAVLSWSGIDQIPSDLDPVLWDAETARAVPLRTVSVITVDLLAGDAYTLQLLVGPAEIVHRALGELQGPAPAALLLHPPAPNPMFGATRLRYALPEPSDVALRIYDLSGRRVSEFLERQQPAGEHVLTWTGRDTAGRRLGAGIYFLRLETRTGSRTAKVVLLDGER